MRRFKYAPVVVTAGILALVLSACGVTYNQAAPGTPVPNNFQLVEQASFSTSLAVVAGDTQYGSVSNGFLSATFNYTDTANKKLAYEHGKFSWFGPTTNVVYSPNGQVEYTLKQNIDSTFLSPYGNAMTYYDIYNSQGEEVAVSQKIDGEFTTVFTITTPDGTPIAQLTRLAGGPNLQTDPNNTGDIWQVVDYQPQALDKDVLIFIAAEKTASDDSSRQQQQNSQPSNNG